MNNMNDFDAATAESKRMERNGHRESHSAVRKWDADRRDLQGTGTNEREHLEEGTEAQGRGTYQAMIDKQSLEDWLEAEITEMRELLLYREADEASCILKHVREMEEETK